MDWGDGTSSSGYHDIISNIDELHQYSESGFFYVTVTYCSSSACPEKKCCDYYTKIIKVY